MGSINFSVESALRIGFSAVLRNELRISGSEGLSLHWNSRKHEIISKKFHLFIFGRKNLLIYSRHGKLQRLLIDHQDPIALTRRRKLTEAYS